MTGNIFTVDTKFGPATIAVTAGEGAVLFVVSLGALPAQRITLEPSQAGKLGKSLLTAAQLAKEPTHG